MVAGLERVASWCGKQLEASLLPAHGHCIKRIIYYACQFFRFLLFLPLVAILYPLSFVATQLFGSRPKDTPLVAFAKHPKWKDERMPDPL